MTEYIRCTKCPADWVISPHQDRGERLQAIYDHVLMNHAEMAKSLWDYVEEGVNRCNGDVHSDPHRGCILR